MPATNCSGTASGERGPLYNIHVHVKEIEAKQCNENSYYILYASLWDLYSSINKQGLSEMCR